jgi:hypothetical protein
MPSRLGSSKSDLSLIGKNSFLMWLIEDFLEFCPIIFHYFSIVGFRVGEVGIFSLRMWLKSKGFVDQVK